MFGVGTQIPSCTPNDNVKDHSGSYAVFTEQGSSASQITAAKVMDIVSRLSGCVGQAADAVSACTQVTKDNALELLNISKSECPDTGCVYQNTSAPNHGLTSKNQSFLMNGICIVTHLPGG